MTKQYIKIISPGDNEWYVPAKDFDAVWNMMLKYRYALELISNGLTLDHIGLAKETLEAVANHHQTESK